MAHHASHSGRFDSVSVHDHLLTRVALQKRLAFDRKKLQLLALTVLAVVLLGASSARAQTPGPLEALKNESEEAYQNRDFLKSIQLADQVLTQSPQDHVALYLRASSRIEQGISTNSLDLVRQGIDDARQALTHEKNGKPEYYLPYIYGMTHLSILENKPVHAQTARTWADSVLEREDLTHEQRGNLYYQRAQANLQLKDSTAAEQDLQEAVSLAPDHLAAQLLLAKTTAQTKSPAEAVAAYTRSIQAFPSHAIVYNERGAYLQSIGRLSEAVADYNKAIEIDRTFMPALVNRGVAYMDAGDLATAENTFNQVLVSQPDNLTALRMRGATKLNQNKANEALVDYRKVIELSPKNAMAYADLGFAHFFMKDYRPALNAFEAALRLDPQMRFLHPWKLACEIRVSQPKPEYYQASLTKPESSRDWVDNLVLFQSNRIDARQLLSSVHTSDESIRDAQLAEANYFIGVELLRRGRENDAVAYWKLATQKKLPNLSAYRGAVFALNHSSFNK